MRGEQLVGEIMLDARKAGSSHVNRSARGGSAIMKLNLTPLLKHGCCRVLLSPESLLLELWVAVSFQKFERGSHLFWALCDMSVLLD